MSRSVNDLNTLTAVQAVLLLKNQDVTPLEMIDAALARIEETDGSLNALPTLRRPSQGQCILVDEKPSQRPVSGVSLRAANCS